jgi:aryl-alcohol dehydrogenase-like predicted oxidoreductase
MKLGLGTVQFGIDYGVSNKLGQTTSEEVNKILEFAATQNISYLDTAPAYGDSEIVLGHNLTSPHSFRLVTKTNKIDKPNISDEDVKLTLNTFKLSLKRLKQSSVYGLLVHHPDDLLGKGGDRLMAGLESLKEQGLVTKIGISVYNRKQIDMLLDRYSISLLQIPMNVFDQRFIENSYLQEIKSKNIEIHARSVFLQGLLFMTEKDVPNYISEIIPHLQKYHQANKRNGVSSLQAAVGFVNTVQEVDTLLVGINTLEQLKEIVSAIDYKADLTYLQELAVQDERLVNPALWRQ